MKKLLFYVIVSLSVVCTLDSCKKEKNPAPKPQSSEISVRQPEAYPAEGGEFSIRYSIENPKEGASLEVSTGDKWITGLKANEKEISFSLETNDTGDERTGSIDLSYEGAEPAKITIRQKTPVYQPVDENGTANCYIVSGAGKYHFSAVKGNGSEAVGTVATVDNAKKAVRFTTATEFRKGNALIAAKDASGKILWSWHIWMTDKPEDQGRTSRKTRPTTTVRAQCWTATSVPPPPLPAMRAPSDCSTSGAGKTRSWGLLTLRRAPLLRQPPPLAPGRSRSFRMKPKGQ